MKKLLVLLGLSVLVFAGCSGSTSEEAPAADDTSSDTEVELSSDIQEVKMGFEAVDLGVTFGNCESALLAFTEDAAVTEADCDTLTEVVGPTGLSSSIDWAATTIDGDDATLYLLDGTELTKMHYTEEGLVWGWKISEKWWE